MQVGVAYSEPSQQVWLHVEVPEGATVQGAIELSGVLRLFPRIDLTKQKVGIFARVVKLDAVLRPGDRVEIYRPITCDPKTVRKRADGEESGAAALEA